MFQTVIYISRTPQKALPPERHQRIEVECNSEPQRFTHKEGIKVRTILNGRTKDKIENIYLDDFCDETF
jgi:hypothetical protein